MNSGEKNSLSGRKRKSLHTDDDEELPSKRARSSKEEIRSCSSKKDRRGKRIYLCSSDECTNQAVNGGLCIRHGAKRTLCSAAKDVQIQVTKEDFVLCMHRSRRNNAAQKGAQSSREARNMRQAWGTRFIVTVC
mmetsp:Transcript_22171/g.37822  ORF Transcript_22171/g.37822 Transcript_22171/m.37822 type:complete len:134 (+) Transcript_22171:1460-1861(+)